MRRSGPATKAKTAPPPIAADSLYRLKDLADSHRWGFQIQRALKEAGLPTITIGRVRYVHGAELIEFLRENRSIVASGQE